MSQAGKLVRISPKKKKTSTCEFFFQHLLVIQIICMWWNWQPYLCNIYSKKGEGDEAADVERAVSGPRDCGWPIRCKVEDIGANINKFGQFHFVC